jgi:phosphoribosylanthranilate isomerase
MFVKICGLTDGAAIEAAIEAGADAIGFVFAESAREIDPVKARKLCRSVPKETIRVAVMRHPSIEKFERVIEVFEPDWVQTDAGDFESLPSLVSARPLPVLREDETGTMDEFPERLLFEGRVSGSGEKADWAEARRVASRTDLILAGGLDPDNVGDAIASVEPFGVDVSSGVERERGIKDPVKIREFVARVRALESER